MPARLIGLMRLGRDPEMRYTQGGEAVMDLSLAYDYGRKGEDGKRPTQWVRASLWGKRAEALAPYLQRGQQVLVHLADPAIVAWESSKTGKSGHSLEARVEDIELVARSRGDGDQAAPAAATAAAAAAPVSARRAAPAAKGNPFVDDDEVPF